MNQRFTYHIRPSATSFAQTFTFSAKERDSETGFSYFGSRYYSSDLSIWLSVDPQAAKYPSLSPYVYCANNPVKLVDPNGEEIGNFFDGYGKYLGTDGSDNQNVYIVTNSKDQKKIKSQKTTNPSDVEITLSTTTDVLQETYAVYDRTKKNGGDKEEAATFDLSGEKKTYPTGTRTMDIDKEGSVSIHSHLLVFLKGKDGKYNNVQTPSDLSGDDKKTFKGYGLNIVVGLSNCNSDLPASVGCQGRIPQAVFYNRDASEIITMDLSDITKILNYKPKTK